MPKISHDDAGQRLDRWLSNQYKNLSFGIVQKLVRTGQIRVNGKRIKHDYRLNTGDEVRLPPKIADIQKDKTQNLKNIDLSPIADNILLEDEDLFILNKPAGLAVQGGSKTTHHIDKLMAVWTQKHKWEAPHRLVHRLDKETSGVFIIAKNRPAAKSLAGQFKEHTIQKIYLSMNHHAPNKPRGMVDIPIQKVGTVNQKVMVDENGQSSVSHYELLKKRGQHSFFRWRPVTGRTHQLRVHSEYLGCPIVGDKKYGLEDGEENMFLHCQKITFIHPTSNKEMAIDAPLPDHFLAKDFPI